MCFHSKQTKKAIELEHRFRAKFENQEAYTPSIFNGFQFPKTPIITNSKPQNIQLFNWGLIPNWAQDASFRKNTLNARLETLHEKPSFKNILNHRCLILLDGFYEWQWLDEKGKYKQKYLIEKPGGVAFAMAGLWSEWTDKKTGELLSTYTIITTSANELMSKIHNTKKRMPYILGEDEEEAWLNGAELSKANPELVAIAI